MRPSDFQLESILVADRTAMLRAAAAAAGRAAPGLRRRLGKLLVGAGVRLAPELRPARRLA